MSSLSAVLFFLILLTSNCSCDSEVVIIGAGAAGLAAATKLLEHSVNVQILEAESRIGGRIHTTDFADGLVDLGAQPGLLQNDKNIIYSMMNDLNLIHSAPLDTDILTTDKKLYEDDIFYEATDIFINVYSRLNESIDKTMKDEDINNLFNKQYKEYTLKLFPDNEKKQKVALSLLKDLKKS